MYERFVTDVRSHLGEPAFASAWEAGKALGLDEAAAEARLLAGHIASLSKVASPQSGKRLPEALTRREIDVLRLLCDGLTDREIAAQLFISTRTASNHVSSILAKLGVATRTAAASEARRRGLVRTSSPPDRATVSSLPNE